MKKKSKITAGLLGIFLGTLGVHNFYIGSYGKAIAQLLITVLSAGSLAFISLCWGLVEGILILTNCIDINQKYRKEQGTIEENKEFAKETFKRFNSNRTPAIDYIKKHTRLSVEEIQQVENEFDLENEKLKEYKKSELEKKQNESQQNQQEKQEPVQEKTNNEKVEHQANVSNNNSNNIGCIIGIIILLVIGFFIVKGVSGIYHFVTDVTDTKGNTLAMQYLDRDEIYADLYVNTTYSIGKIKNCSNSKIIENNGDKYIFKVTVYYNPKLNSGSTDLSKENQGTTYVVYNKKTEKYLCCSTLEKAKDSNIWKDN